MYLVRALVCLLALATCAFAAPQYTVVDLGEDADVFGVDANGVAFGMFQGQAAIFTPTPIPLGLLGGEGTSSARARNLVTGTVGQATINDGRLTQAFWRRGGALKSLGGIAADTFSTASAITLTFIAGWGDDTRLESKPLVWTFTNGQPGERQLLPTLGGFTGFADAAKGFVVVGQSETVDRSIHATMWVMGLAFDLTPGTGNLSFANAINNTQTVVGELNNHAWRWTPGGGSEDLGQLPNSGLNSLLAVNASGVAVGVAFTFTDDSRIAAHGIRLQGTALSDLNDLVTAPHWILQAATGISDRGIIAGNGLRDRVAHGYLLVPIPE